MSENGSVTTTVPGDPDDRIFDTDGVALPGIEVRVVDGDGKVVKKGVEGHLQCRGISMFIGYFRRPELSRPTSDGWFDTGDLARMNADGYIRITGRAKDIIIRGGENIPVVEVENLLYRHPAIRQVAIVGVPQAEDTRALLRAVFEPFAPNKVVAGGEAQIPLLEGRAQRNGHAAAYVCQHYLCQAPTSDPDELRKLLSVVGEV